VLSSLCEESTAIFEITKDNGLKHKQSGKCVHPFRGSPAERIHLVTWSGCESPGGKLMLELFKLLKQGTDLPENCLAHKVLEMLGI
jgi:hypothetical protein